MNDDPYSISAGLDELDRLEEQAREICTRCDKRFVETYAPDGKGLCLICCPGYARELIRAAKLERRRQARLFPPTMAVPKGRMRRRGR